MNRKSVLCITLSVMMGMALNLSSCGTSESISTTSMERYFVRNDIDSYTPRLIQSQEELETYFGMATVMGANGKPTPVDFSKKNVIAIIDSATDRETEIKVTSVKKQDDKLVVSYKVVTSGEPRSYSIVPCLLLQIDKKYGNAAVFVKE